MKIGDRVRWIGAPEMRSQNLVRKFMDSTGTDQSFDQKTGTVRSFEKSAEYTDGFKKFWVEHPVSVNFDDPAFVDISRGSYPMEEFEILTDDGRPG